MDPSSNQAAGIQLPPPVVDGAAAPAQPGGQVATALPLPPAPTAQQPIMQPQQPQQVQGIASTAALTASDDKDLIEKEWVNKAKAIVERTQSDPYKQSEELTMVKADYMKKRYNKVIKLK